MEIEITSGFVLSSEIVAEIVKKKLAYLSSDYNLILKPIHIPRPTKYGRAGRYSTLEFTVSNPKIENSTHILTCFVKIPPLKNINTQYSFTRILGLFNREVELYVEVFPKILKSEDREIVPQCFYAEKDRIVILEDIESENYTTVNKMKELDFLHCSVVLKSLARFHARTIVYQEKESGFPLLGGFKDAAYDQSNLSRHEDFLKIFCEGIGHSLAEVFELIPQLMTLNRQEFRSQFRSLVETFFETITSKDFSPMRVLCHSDLMASNLLFRYNENNEPDMCCMVDFQHTKYSSPSYEIWSFLYENTTDELRHKRKKDLQKIYYDTLCKYLNEEEVDAYYIFPYEKYLHMLERDHVYGLIQGILNLYYELREEMKFRFGDEYRQILKKMWMNCPDFLYEDFDDLQRYKHRIVQAILELYPLIVGHDINMSG